MEKSVNASLSYSIAMMYSVNGVWSVSVFSQQQCKIQFACTVIKINIVLAEKVYFYL